MLNKKNKGMTLVELLVYVALLAIASTILLSLVATLVQTQYKTSAEREVWDSSQRAMDRMIREIQKASAIDQANSTFGSNPGELELDSYINASDPSPTSIRFFVSNDHLYMKTGTDSPETLTGDKIKITNFVLNQYAPSNSTPAVKINLTVEKNTALSEPNIRASTTLTSLVNLRNY